MSAAVMSSSLYDISELLIKQQQQQQQTNDVGKLGWDNCNDDDTLITRNSTHNLPLSIVRSLLFSNITNPHRRIERTQSEPTKTPSININTSSRYKTELCRPFEESGTCKYGDKCQFAHGGHELRCLVRHPKYKTELCRTFHSVGFCPYGPRCHFIHNADEARGATTSTTTNTTNTTSSTAVANNTATSTVNVGGGVNQTILNNTTKSTRSRHLSLETTNTNATIITPSPPSSQGSISPPPLQHQQVYAYGGGPQTPTNIITTSLTPPHSPSPPPASPERLPVFNRISAPPNNALIYNTMTLRFHGSELLV